jgi:hypothetical protein
LQRLVWSAWLRMVIATFILPSLLALIFGILFRLKPGEIAGIFMVSAAKWRAWQIAHQSPDPMQLTSPNHVC